ncbi:hypothetical protein DRQ17_00965 [bacterium]|nr:MAG: hypothetical protein DRQ17_00965 [bacterium]
MYSLYFLPVFVLIPHKPEKINLSKYFTSPVDSIQILSTDGVDMYPIIEGKIMVQLKGNVGSARINVFSGGDSFVKDMLFVRSKSRKIKFIYRGSGRNVYLAGSFNGWNSNALPMIKTDSGFVAEIQLSPGRYAYKFVVDGKWIQDTNNPLSEDDGYGGRNSILIVKGGHEFIDDISPSHYRFPFTLSRVYILNGDRLLDEENYSIKGRDVFLKNLKTDVIRIVGIGRKGEISGPFTFNIKPEPPIGGIMYFLFVDRFFEGDGRNMRKIKDPEVPDIANFMGGDLKGVILKLKDGYFDSLGISVLWISPVFLCPEGAYRDALPPHRKFTGYHGYWPVDLYRIDPSFGDMDDLKELVQECHKRGIKVFLDMVLNHVHESSRVYKKHRDWFTSIYLPDGQKNIRLFDEHPFTTWFDEFLPSFDFSKDSVVEYLSSAAKFWIKEVGIDGFRLDAVKHIPHEFWRVLRRRMEVERHVWMIGETISSREKINEWISPSELDGQFDFPLFWVLRDALAGRTGMDRLMQEIVRSQDAFSDGLWVPFMDNHDFGRLVSFINGDLLGNEKELAFVSPPGKPEKKSYHLMKIGFAILYSLPGLPMIYYGDEIGLPGAGDPDNRRMMRFKHDSDEELLLKEVKKLAGLRRKSRALRFGRVVPIKAGNEYMVYMKKYFSEKVVCGFNRGEKDIVVGFKDPFTGKHIKLTIPGEGYRMEEI